MGAMCMRAARGLNRASPGRSPDGRPAARHPDRHHHSDRRSAGLPALMAAYGKAQLEALWLKAGGAKSVAPTMAAIALAESDGNPSSINPEGPQHAEGLWQIKGQLVPGNILNPEVNAANAVAKYRSQGLGAWTTYTEGAYKKYLTPSVEMALARKDEGARKSDTGGVGG